MLATPVAGGNAAYLDWLDKELVQADRL